MKGPDLGMLKDKRVQIAAAGAAAIGLVVLLKKGSGGTSAAAGTGTATTGTLDSTGTDSYNAIGQIGQAWQDTWNTQFQDFSGQLQNINDTLGGLKQPVTPIPTKIPPINPKQKTGAGWVFVKPGMTVDQIAARYHTTAANIRALNTSNALNRFSPGETIRIRGAAGPKPPGSK